MKNRPDLIENAEKRRRHLMELMHARETRKNNINMHILEHVRSSMPEKENFVRTREMRLSSARKYTRLPEVQKRVRDMRLLQNRQANRIMTQIFNKVSSYYYHIVKDEFVAILVHFCLSYQFESYQFY